MWGAGRPLIGATLMDSHAKPCAGAQKPPGGSFVPGATICRGSRNARSGLGGCAQRIAQQSAAAPCAKAIAGHERAYLHQAAALRPGPERPCCLRYRRAQKSVTASRGPSTSKVSSGRSTVSDWMSDTKA